MDDGLAALAAQFLSAVIVLGAGLILFGIPLAIWEAMFGPIGGRGRGGLYPSDRSSQELYERRIRDSHRR